MSVRSGVSSEIRRARALRERSVRDSTGLCYVEGIRQVFSAVEGGHDVDCILVDPLKLKSNAGWEAVAQARAAGARLVELKSSDFERISSRDNPVGLAAIVSWRPLQLESLKGTTRSLYLMTDDIHDPGNLGTLVRTADGAGCSGIVVSRGVDPAHPTALRASLGTAFRMPIATAPSLDEVFAWAAERNVSIIATTAHTDQAIWEAGVRFPAAVLVGSEGEGLPAAAIAQADSRVSIPMCGTATSLNVSVAAGIVLYEVARRLHADAVAG